MKYIGLVLIIFSLALAACAPQPQVGSQQPTQGAGAVLPPATTNPSETISSDQTPTPGEEPRSPLEPLPNEEKMVRGSVIIEESDLLILESYPPQFVLSLKGTLPTPCHFLRANVGKPDAEKRIQVEVYSLAEPDVICIQIVQPFDVNLPLGSFTDGPYTVLVNDQKVGEITP